ncbi:MAG TPA: AAA family ATPase [Methanomassiliicoccaceae archaeon]|jgi:hypothetical protein|nr:AAA family ATPase [Euryarchaeota archaeon]HOB38131.1 AAA family ATPase [Methanomassiliicoccaceae archaeon]HOK28544.1 AAA family ATPase [Methanomassiliicoccaceae archaeon]HQA21179.1 AAA family ATPase [Methanomassiliicoccaceae archaeon]HQD87945.1 AAA family ATPase [Methanomassiliicoccaceae archaeon]
MAPVLSIVIRNYRRFRGEIELPLSGGMDVIQIPPGMGKSSVAEAVAWCLTGVMSRPDVINVEALEAGEDTMVSLTFSDADNTVLERSMSHVAGVGLMERPTVRPVGSFEERREQLFPSACIDSNIISGASIGRVMQGERTGGERALEQMKGWMASDAILRSSMEATSLYLSMVSDPAVSCLIFDERGRLGVQCDGPPSISIEEYRTIVLASALAFARENCPGSPVILDEPFKELGEQAAWRAAEAVAEFMDGHQLVLLLSEQNEIEALRSTGRLRKELEIMG